MNKEIIFWGTPELSVTIMKALLEAGYTIAVAVTMPDRPVGRKHIMTASPVKVFALENNIPVLQPEKINDEFLEELKKYKPNLAIVVAYGKIISQNVIDAFPQGLLNIHYSLLPLYRGASPVENAILNGDTETGVAIQKLIYKMDAGDVVAEEVVQINNTITAPDLRIKLTEVGAKLLTETLPGYLESNISPQEQDESLATHCGKFSKADGEIKLTDPEKDKWLKYRAYYTWPKVFYFNEDGKRVKITEAVWENDRFVIKRIIPEGKSERDY